MQRLMVVAMLVTIGCVRAAGAAEFSNGVPSDPAFFPIAVWLQAPSNAGRYKEIGINTYVGLWKGPTEQQLDALEKAGMHVICDQNAVGLKNRDRKVIIAWMHGDEPDNAQELGGGRSGYGPPILPEKIVVDYKRIKAADPTRPVLLNLGQGVAWDRWYGRGVRSNHPEDYPEYVKGCDIASFDIYPVTHDRAEVAGKLWYVGHGTQRLVGWTDGRKPVWACIETTHIGNEKALPTPKQVHSEVWMAIINGARGLIYFAHEFKPKFIEAGMLAHPEIAQAVKSVNAEIAALAPVLNSPALPEAAKVTSSEKDVPIAILCKRHGGATYVFAVSMREKSAKGAMTIAGLTGNSSVEVIGEARSIPAVNGVFEDAFEGYAVHAYRIGR